MPTSGRSEPVCRVGTRRLERIGELILRWGLVLVVGWIGAMKFTGYEASGIEPLVANSPLMSWVYAVFSVQDFSNVLGTVEIAIAIMISLRWWSGKIAAVGCLLAVGMFLTTLTFLISTPGTWEPSLGGFPALSLVPAQFLLKDFVLLGAAVYLLAEALSGSGFLQEVRVLTQTRSTGSGAEGLS